MSGEKVSPPADPSEHELPAAETTFRLSALLTAVVLVCGVMFLGLGLAYPIALDAAAFTLFVLAFAIVPGLVATEYLFGNATLADGLLAYVLATGLIVDLLFLVPLWALGLLWLFWLLPPLALGILLVRWRKPSSILPLGLALGNNLTWVAAYLFCWLVAEIQLGHLLGGPAKASALFHHAFQGVIAASVAQGWPPPNLTLPDVPLSYHYAVHLWVVAAKMVTGVSIDVLVGRYGPVFMVSTVIFTMFGFCRHVLKLPWWAIYLATSSVFWIFGVPVLSGQVFGTFTPYASILIMSPAGGFLVFFVSAALVVRLLESEQAVPWHAYVVLAALAFVGVGARAVVAPILFCSLGLLILVGLGRGATFLRRIVLMEMAVAVGAVGGLFFFFTLGGDFSGTGFVTFSGQPFSYLTSPYQTMLFLPHTLMSLGVNWLLAGMVTFAVIALFQPGFLTPVFFFDLKHLFKEHRDANILLAGASIAGICAVFLTNAEGYSQFTFLQYSNIAMSIIGAEGAVKLTSRVRAGWNWRLIAFASATAGLFLLQVIQTPTWAVTAAWANLLAKHPADVVPGVAQAVHPDISTCVRPADVEMFQAIRQIDRKSIVIIPGIDIGCAAMWWTAYVPLQTIQTYGVTYEPGTASPAFADRLAKRTAAFLGLQDNAAKGEVEVTALVKLAALLDTERPIFVVLKKEVHVTGGPPLTKAFENDRFVVLRIPTSE